MKNKEKKQRSKKVKPMRFIKNDISLSEKTSFGIVEAYKTIRTNLLFSIAANSTNTIIISSAGPLEGKSTTCANLAITLSQTSAKVLLVDADMRKPTQHKIFRADNSTGLSQTIGGFELLDDVVQKEIRPNLDLLTAGQIPPNPAELLGSKNMQMLMSQLSDEYDYIILDTPPVNVVADALVLLNNSVGIVLVCRQKKTTYEELKKAVERVKFTGVRLLGVVVTFVKQNEKLYGGYKSYKNYNYK